MASALIPLGMTILSSLLRGGAKHKKGMMKVRPRRRVYGSGVMDFLRKGRDFLKKHQVVSKLAGVAQQLGVKPELASKIGTAAKTFGYGRRRVYASGLRLAGGSKRRTRGGARVYL